MLFKSQVLLLGLPAISQLMDYATDGAQKMFDIIDISLEFFSSFHSSCLLFIKILALNYIIIREKKNTEGFCVWDEFVKITLSRQFKMDHSCHL